MTTENRLRLAEVEQRVCDVASEQLGIPRQKISPSSRLLEDLQCDSLDLVELFMELEDAFAVTLPNDPPNMVYKVASGVLADWFVLDPDDDRQEHQLIQRSGEDWQPLPSTERWPMMLVSWFGANAYSLWANGRDWQNYQDQRTEEAGCFLPTEAHWEYAARGARYRSFPWGDQPPSQDRMVYGLHRKSVTYEAVTLPLVDVNEQLGMSPFGLHHMAGNVWQWCRDWYSEDFYSKPAAREPNPVNRIAGQVRSERGGSWIGPAELCRSSYRRGRPPHARGRCLGFRCISSVDDLP